MMKPPSPFSIPNIRLFILFRILFNSRFYYPVFTILFLDYGLTIEQFSLLNTVWAITIFCAEVPSGALADIIGRRQLVVGTSFLMVVEMALICFVPLGNGTLIFSVFLLNRILSGLAEALASGADEAIAYDSLAAEGDTRDWPRVLSVQMRLRSVAAVISMAVGALIYDPATVNRLLAWIGSNLQVTQQTTMRYPIFLTLLLAVAACVVTLRIREPADDSGQPPRPGDILRTMNATGRMTLAAGRWIFRTPFALAVILFGMVYDHVLRLIVTLTSQYFRLISLPEASFGLIGAGMSLLGIVSPKVAEAMVQRFSPAANVLWLAALTLIALSATAAFFPYLGLLPIALIFFLMMLESFFSSHYLNRITPSHQRATVLSFKGMAFNLAYGMIGILFAVLVAELRHRGAADQPLPIADAAFIGAIGWLPWYALVVLVPIIAYFSLRLRNSEEIRRRG
ncbi:MFS transporter [Desulfoprunum benzoelyticum]|uniref:MFS family permease n=2 Tax=Desulfoprunum benzoelyticum TaxID=1506996 RepID=A0A840USQ3_9BACT|nr:MFS transporter [Desulfoprunum benzoelyticum]MBB5347866.1 MFS family permease [Desulfoprunum benzoelyticum]MBM9531736.1 MFS transporter [Desulfoprunum benzoelyticum]